MQTERDVYDCSDCGAEVNVDAIYCHICGTRFDEDEKDEPESGSISCTRCNFLVSGGFQFCPNCGFAIAIDDTLKLISADIGLNELPSSEKLDGDYHQDGSHFDEENLDYESSNKQRYPALRTIATSYRIVAWLIIFFSLISAVGLIVNFEGLTAFLFSFGAVLFGAIISLTLFALAESIDVILDIEENQRIQVGLFENLQKSMQSLVCGLIKDR
jgi:DNA-directed RNA polymerase subunit RPC12/RpoP